MSDSKDVATPRPNYVATVVISDDGSWPRIAAKNLWEHIGISLPTGLEIVSTAVAEEGDPTREAAVREVVEALKGVAVDLFERDGSGLCWCPFNFRTELYQVEETGEHSAECNAARNALAAYEKAVKQ